MLRIAAVVTAAMLVTACITPIRQHKGYLADEVLLQSVQAGIDNRASVERTLGQPSFVSQYGQPVWYYIGSNTKQAPFTTPKIEEHAVLAIRFDPAGNVTSVERTGLERVAYLDPESDETPTLGRERTFLEDLFGNIGQVSAGGAPGGGG